jgi:hypothetical protein
MRAVNILKFLAKKYEEVSPTPKRPPERRPAARIGRPTKSGKAAFGGRLLRVRSLPKIFARRDETKV